MHVFKVRKKSVSLCWDILKHDVPLVETTCTDRDGDEEHCVVHHELHQLQPDASLDIGGRNATRELCVFGRMPGVPKLVGFPHETLQGFRSVDG